MKRRERERARRKKIERAKIALVAFLGIILVLLSWYALGMGKENTENAKNTRSTVPLKKQKDVAQDKEQDGEQTATIMASGDMLYHDVVYGGAFDGENFDFTNNYTHITPLISSADLALGDFEGTINPDRELAGYPVFNAPEVVVESIKNAGYDAITLAHNHVLDTGIDGLLYTANAFKKEGLDVFGVNVSKDQDILVKNINGIKIALLGYSYGFNGIEATISESDYNTYLKDLNMEKVQKEIERAEEIADITVVMPQLGVEYSLTPSEEQQETYRKMVDFGADIIFGGHPHVAQPTEIIEKDGEKKFILYSMGNLLSNQRFETLENYWTERGVIMEVQLTKKNKKTVLSDIKAHPTWVSREPKGGMTFNGYTAYDYQVLLAEDYLKDGKQADTVPEEKRQRIETAYHEMMELLDIKW
ncbi:CapA family protein [Vagococcus elongatus]|uniref:Metallophosphatase n=1 Tax=Vagococcus elongatus TaxID=180344 RepID=A0A430B3Y2_9ENTE|nr:CapA family protein [Vagococcus elongatus]RSU15040.1 metallophosphatase [Vagococcus elongatus]